jgi:hypothetical protein
MNARSIVLWSDYEDEAEITPTVVTEQTNPELRKASLRVVWVLSGELSYLSAKKSARG